MEKKRVLVLCVVIVLAVAAILYLTVLSPNQPAQDNNPPAISERLSNAINDFFTSTDPHKAVTMSGEDVTEKFYEDNLESFNNGDLKAIADYMMENEISLHIERAEK